MSINNGDHGATIAEIPVKPSCRVDWSAMTPQQIWDALQSVPKVAGPWEESRRNGSHVYGYVGRYFKSLHTSEFAAYFFPSDQSSVSLGSFATEEECKAAIDAELQRRGWLLV